MSKNLSKYLKNLPNSVSKSSSLTLSERIRKCQELLSEIKPEIDDEDEDVIYCGTIEYDPEKVKTIRNFFSSVKEEKLENEQNCGKIRKVKHEQEASFVIDLDEIEDKSSKNHSEISKVMNEEEASFVINLDNIEDKNDQNLPNIRNCRVVLKDVNKEIAAGKFKHLEITKFGAIKEVCPFCRTFFLKKNISRHIDVVHPKQTKNLPFGCEFCSSGFTSISGMKIHIRKMHPEVVKTKNQICDFDGKIFKNRKELFEHMRQKHLKVKCHICDVEMRQLYLKKHLVTHITVRKFQCEICKKCFKSNIALRQHLQTHTKIHKCKYCSRKFAFNNLLVKHVKYFHDNPFSFQCNICDKKFSTLILKKLHQNVHDKNRPTSFKCHECNYATNWRNSLKIHLKSHENQRNRLKTMKNPVKCDNCFKYCRNLKELRRHKIGVHSKFNFQCDFCGKIISSKSYLRSHIQSKNCQKAK